MAPKLIKSISPTPALRGSSERFTAVVDPLPSEVTTGTFFPVFILKIGAKSGEEERDEIFVGVYTGQELLNRVFINANIPPTVKVGNWKLTFQIFDPKGRVTVIDSVDSAEFDIV